MSSQGVEIFKGVFIRIFGMDGLASGKINGLRRFGDGHVLRPATAQVHLDASVFLIIQDEMGKGRYVKIGAEFTVHAVQEVQIEGSGHSLSIIVRRQEQRKGFFQINAKQEDILWSHQRRSTLQEGKAFFTGKIAEIGAKKRQRFFLQVQGPNDVRIASKVSVYSMDREVGVFGQ